MFESPLVWAVIGGCLVAVGVVTLVKAPRSRRLRRSILEDPAPPCRGVAVWQEGG